MKTPEVKPPDIRNRHSNRTSEGSGNKQSFRTARVQPLCYSIPMTIITIPKRFADKGDLVVIPKKELDELIARAGDEVTEQDVLRWSREAKRLRRAGKLSRLA